MRNVMRGQVYLFKELRGESLKNGRFVRIYFPLVSNLPKQMGCLIYMCVLLSHSCSADVQLRLCYLFILVLQYLC